MKILETQSAILTNHEVLTHLTFLTTRPRSTPPAPAPAPPPSPPSSRSSPSSSPNPTPTSTTPTNATTSNTTLPPSLQTIHRDLTTYLLASVSPPTTNPPSLPQTNNPSPSPNPMDTTDLIALTKNLREYGLTKAEVLMCVNLRVRDLGLLDCVVEEMDERVGEGGQEGLLGVLGGVFGEVGGEGEGEGEG